MIGRLQNLNNSKPIDSSSGVFTGRLSKTGDLIATRPKEVIRQAPSGTFDSPIRKFIGSIPILGKPILGATDYLTNVGKNAIDQTINTADMLLGQEGRRLSAQVGVGKIREEFLKEPIVTPL